MTRETARAANLEAAQGDLLTERARLLADASHLSDDERAIAQARFAESDAGGDQADVASDYVEQEILETLENTVRATLMDVDAALDRIKSGTYGLCEDCGEAIDRARLKARPWASRCLKCQRRVEMRLAR